MPYDNNNHLITAPIGIGDISQALNNSSTDLGTLCSSVPQSKKWAKYKPEHWAVNGQTAPIGFLKDSDRKKNHYGLSWFPNMADWRTFMKECVKLQNNQVYKYNTITSSEPKRIADFLKFGEGSTPATSTYGFINNAVGPVASLELDMDSPYPQGGHININWSVANSNSINFSDLVEITGSADGLYYGVLFVQCTTSGPNDSAYNILNVDQGNVNQAYSNYVTLVWHVDRDEGIITPEGPYDPSASNPSDGIDAEDIHHAGLTPQPWAPTGTSVDPAEWEYIFVPVLFRKGLINDFNAGYCTYPINFQINNTYTNIRVLPLPIKASDATPLNEPSFIVRLSSSAQAQPDLAVLLYQFEGTLNNSNIQLQSAVVYLRGSDEESTGASRRVLVDFYYGDSATSSYTPVVSGASNPFSVNENEETTINFTNWPANVSITSGQQPLRYRIYIEGHIDEKYEDMTVMSRFSGGE